MLQAFCVYCTMRSKRWSSPALAGAKIDAAWDRTNSPESQPSRIRASSSSNSPGRIPHG